KGPAASRPRGRAKRARAPRRGRRSPRRHAKRTRDRRRRRSRGCAGRGCTAVANDPSDGVPASTAPSRTHWRLFYGRRVQKQRGWRRLGARGPAVEAGERGGEGGGDLGQRRCLTGEGGDRG